MSSKNMKMESMPPFFEFKLSLRRRNSFLIVLFMAAGGSSGPEKHHTHNLS